MIGKSGMNLERSSISITLLVNLGLILALYIVYFIETECYHWLLLSPA